MALTFFFFFLGASPLNWEGEASQLRGAEEAVTRVKQQQMSVGYSR